MGSDRYMGGIMSAAVECAFCRRIMLNPCRSTRDMSRIDGHNHDPICNDALAGLGGGERRETKRSAVGS